MNKRMREQPSASEGRFTHGANKPAPSRPLRNVTFGRVLRTLRERAGLSQEALARVLEVSPLSLTNWERGVSRPYPINRRRILDYFGVSPEQWAEYEACQPTPLVAPLVAPLVETQAAPDGRWPSAPRETSTIAGQDDGPELWSAPSAPSRFFVGREDVLTRLREGLVAERRAALTQTQALSGLGGIGKTQVALAYASRYRQAYRQVLWVRAESAQSLLDDFATIARLLRLPQASDQNQLGAAQAVNRWLEAHASWLLILDNADDLERIADYIPTTGAGHTLITTRAQAAGSLATMLPLDAFTEEDGATLVLRRAKLLATDAPLGAARSEQQGPARAIARLMDGVPLALDQAGAYIEECGCSPAEYEALARSRLYAALGRRGRFSAQYPQSLVAVLTLTIERIVRAHPDAAALLFLYGFLHPDALPTARLTDCGEALPAPLRALAADQFALDATLETLRGYGLVRRDSATGVVTMHRLTQVIVQGYLRERQPDAFAEWARCLAGAVATDYRAVDSVPNWTRCQAWLPHVEQVAALVAGGDLATEQACDALVRAGTYLEVIGQYASAERYLRLALTCRPDARVQAHPMLAIVLFHMGRASEGEALLRGTIAWLEARDGADAPSLALALFQLGTLCLDSYRLDEAIAQLQRAIAIIQRQGAPDAFTLGNALNTLAHAYLRIPNLDRASAHFAEVQALWTDALGPEHPYIASVLNSRGVVATRLGQYADAERLILRALQIRERMSPPHHSVAYSLHSLGQIYSEQKDWPRAERMYRQALETRERMLEPGHHEIGLSRQALSDTLVALGRYDEALPLVVSAVEIRRARLGPEHPDTLRSEASYVRLLRVIEQGYSDRTNLELA